MNHWKPLKLASVAGIPSTTAARIGLVAVGGAAGAMLYRLARRFPDLYRAIEINANTGHSSLHDVCADQTILICEGREKPALPQEMRALATPYEPIIEAALKPFDLVFILADMGDPTGSGVAPLVAQIAKSAEISAITVAITPFSIEGTQRLANSSSSLAALRQNGDTVFTLDNERLLQAANEGMTRQVDMTFLSLYRTLSQSFHNDGIVGVDFEDVRYVLNQAGGTAMGFASASGDDQIEQSVRRAIAHPLLGSHALEQATGIFVSIRGGVGCLESQDVTEVIKIIRAYQSQAAYLIYDANADCLLGNNIQISILATGIACTVADNRFTGAAS
jgi:cell division protein FtsZ